MNSGCSDRSLMLVIKQAGRNCNSAQIRRRKRPRCRVLDSRQSTPRLRNKEFSRTSKRKGNGAGRERCTGGEMPDEDTKHIFVQGGMEVSTADGGARRYRKPLKSIR